LKDSLRGRPVESDETVIQAINDWFEQLDEKLFVDGVKALGHRWKKMYCA